MAPTPSGVWKSINWASLGTPSWAAGSSGFQVFGWSRGYVGFSIKPNSSTGDTPVDPTVVSYYSPDGTHWKEGQALDTAGAGTQGLLQDIRSVIEGPAGLLAVGWSGACGGEYLDGLWTSSDGTSWQPVDTQKAFGQHGAAIERISGGSAGYVAVASNHSNPGVWTSADGRVWQPVALDAPGFKNSKIDDGTAFSGGYVLVGTYGTLSCADVRIAGPAPTLPPVTAAVWWSADAASWTRVSLPGATSSSDGQSIWVCRLSDRALLVVDDTSSATSSVGRAAWTSTDGRTWRSVTLPADISGSPGISAAEILSDGQRAIVVLPVAYGQKDANGFPLDHLSLQTFDADYALVTMRQSGNPPSIPNFPSYGLVAVGPSGVVVTDGHQLWMGTPSASSVLPSPAVSGSTSLVSSSPLAVGTVLGPQAVVQAFYKYYLTDAAYGDLVGRPDVTPGFIQWLKSFAGAANPIVCAQDNPDSVQAGTAVVAGSSATVTTTEVWNGVLQSPGSGPKVSLALGPVGWQISAVDCGFPPLP
jgi:hypothetical protein